MRREGVKEIHIRTSEATSSYFIAIRTPEKLAARNPLHALNNETMIPVETSYHA